MSADSPLCLLDLTLPTVAENLALDEALLDEAESEADAPDALRLWESPELAVVLGRSSRANGEANLQTCRADGIPVLRRCSGGCAVVVGPGCLMYSVVLGYLRRPQLRMLDEAHRFVLGKVGAALQELIGGVTLQGTSDLVWRGRKFSGNSVRCKRTHLLYHGTLLYDFQLAQIGQYLRTPPREPQYRAGRSHSEFVANLPVDGAQLRGGLRQSFGATAPYAPWPEQRMLDLMARRYAHEAWHGER